LVLVGLAVGALSGCSSDDDPSIERSATSVALEHPAADDATFTALLRLVDDEAWGRNPVHLADWAALGEAAGVTRPSSPAETQQWLATLADDTGFAFAGNGYWMAGAPHEVEAFRDAFGVDLGQVDASIIAGPPPEVREAYLGRFDPSAVEAAVRSDPDWSDRLDVLGDGDAAFYSWGPDASILSSPGPGRPLGVGGNLFVTDDEALWVPSSEVMARMIAGRDHPEESLAGVDDVRSATAVLDDVGAATGALVEARQLSDRDGALAPYEVLAIGNLPPGEEQLGVIVLVHESEEVALDNAERLRAVIEDGESLMGGGKWSDLLDLRDVSVDGRLTVAEVEITRGPSALFDAFYRRDSLYLHDG
jgi:hypothetical protein